MNPSAKTIQSLEAIIQPVLQRLLPRKGRLVVGVSGGADSMALLTLLVHLLPRPQERLIVVHVHHGLRGRSADLDLKLVEQTAQRYGLVFRAFHGDVAAEAKRQKKSLEDAGRLLRQRCFMDVAASNQAKAVLLAQHQDDQVETFLMRLLRGAGRQGLSSMPAKRPFPHPQAPSGLWLIRPLLKVSKADLEHYLVTQRQRWRRDTSNDQLHFTRNQLRHQLLPLLEKTYNPQIRATLAQTMTSLALESDFINLEIQKKQRQVVSVLTTQKATVDLKKFKRLHPALQWGLLSWLWDNLHLPAKSHRHLQRLMTACHQGHAGLALPGQWQARSDQQILHMKALQPEKKTHQEPVLLKTGQTKISLPGFTVTVATMAVTASVPKKRGSNTVMIDSSCGKHLQVRSVWPGDKMQPMGMNGQVKEVRKILGELKLSREERQHWPVILNNKEIIWVYRGPIAESAKITAKTKAAIKITIYRL